MRFFQLWVPIGEEIWLITVAKCKKRARILPALKLQLGAEARSRMNLLRDRLTRRRFLRAGLIGAAGTIVPIAAAARWTVEPANFVIGSATVRELSFYNLHTGESLRTVYFENGAYVPESLREVNYLFRDFRAN